MSPVLLFLLFLKTSALSFGGLGGVPTLHQDLLAMNVPDLDKVFGQALAVGRLSPGPNGLYLVSLGYQLGGIIGGIAAGVALALPPFMVLVIAIGYSRVAHLQRTANALLVLSFALTGLLGFTSWQIMTSSSTDVFEWASGILGFFVSVRSRFNPLAIIGVAAALGIIIYR